MSMHVTASWRHLREVREGEREERQMNFVFLSPFICKLRKFHSKSIKMQRNVSKREWPFLMLKYEIQYICKRQISPIDILVNTIYNTLCLYYEHDL